MAAQYPGSVRVFGTKTDLVDLVLAEHVNTLQDEVAAVETALGTGILSSAWNGTYNSTTTTYATLTNRLINIEAGLKYIEANFVPSSVGVTLTGSQTLTNKTLTSPTINGGTLNATILQQGGIQAATISDTQTLTNKTLTSPVISSIVNTGTLTLPTSTDTLVGRATTDTLTNKTLTSPTVNGATISGTFTSTATITGGIVNPTTLQQGGVQVVTTSDTQTLTNKTLTSPVIASISNSGTITVPTGTDTLVARSSTDTLYNKTIQSPREALVIVASAATGTVNIDLGTGASWYYTSAATANFNLNLRKSSSASLDSFMSVGDGITVVFLNTNGTTPYMLTSSTGFKIDGITVAPKWQFGTAPSTGNASSVDSYVFDVVKTAASTFTVFGSMTKYA